MSPNNTASRIPSSLSKPFAVIRSFLVLSRGLFTAAVSQEMQWFSSDTALAWPSSGSSLPFRICSRSFGCLASSAGRRGLWAGRRPSAIRTVSRLLLKYLHSGRISGSAGWFWRPSPAAYWIFLKIAPLGRGLLTSFTAGKPQLDLTGGSDAFCLGAGGVASSAAASWATLAVYTMMAVKGLHWQGQEPACLWPDLYQTSRVGMGKGKTNTDCR